MRQTGLRRPLIAAALAGLVFFPGFSAQAGPSLDQIGAFGAPFREDAFSRPDTDGCVVGANGKNDCLTPGATVNVLANSKVLYWGAIAGAEDIKYAAVPEGGDSAKNDSSRVMRIGAGATVPSGWEDPSPADGAFGSTPEPGLAPNSQPSEPDGKGKVYGGLFCADQKQLADGKILAVGGTDYYAEPRANRELGVLELEGLKAARVFDPRTNAWTPTGEMKFGRWYPSLVTLPDGKVFVASGVTKLIKPLYGGRLTESGSNVKQTETWDPTTGTWSENGAAAQKSLPLYPRLRLLPNGRVYYDAAGQAYNPFGQSYDEVTWDNASVYNPATKSWRDVGRPGGLSLTGGFRGSTFSQMLPLRPNAQGAYDKAQFLTAGGVLFPTPGSYLPTADSRINTITLNPISGDETLATTPTGSFNRARWYSTGVSLPDGSVFATSGADLDHVQTPGSEQAIRQAELFTPDGKGGGTWKDVAMMKQERTYHNNAVLLPDGRVLVGGHSPIPNGYGTMKTSAEIPGVRKFANNRKDASFEIYSPPYLFRGPRPRILGAPSKIARGRSIEIKLDSARGIDSVVLVRNAAQTHLVDGDQRTVVLPLRQRGGSVVAAVTANPSVLPSGPYLLFVNRKSAKGPIPSVGKQVFVTQGGPTVALTRTAKKSVGKRP